MSIKNLLNKFVDIQEEIGSTLIPSEERELTPKEWYYISQSKKKYPKVLAKELKVSVELIKHCISIIKYKRNCEKQIICRDCLEWKDRFRERLLCKECFNKIKNEYQIKYNQRPEIKQKTKEYGRKYNKEHKEEKNEYQKKYREEHPKKIKEDNKKYREKKKITILDIDGKEI